MHMTSRFCTRGSGFRLGEASPTVARCTATRVQVTRVMRDSQQIAAEHRDLAAHAHRAGAEHHGAEDHLTGHESSRQVLEHTNEAYLHTQKEHQKSSAEHGASGIADDAQQREIAALAYKLWQGRCCPEGTAEEDWIRAEEQLRSR